MFTHWWGCKIYDKASNMKGLGNQVLLYYNWMNFNLKFWLNIYLNFNWNEAEWNINGDYQE